MNDLNEKPASLSPADADFAARASTLLRQRAEEIDGDTASRLNRARQRALGRLGPRRARRQIWWLVPAASAAGVLILALALRLSLDPGPGEAPVAVVPPLATPDATIPTAAEPADMDLLLADDNLEMIEDLEFYTWMEPGRTDDELPAEPEAAG